MNHRLLTTREAAQKLGITAGRVRQMILAGQLPSEKPGRDLMIRESDLSLVADRRPGRPSQKAEAMMSSTRNRKKRVNKKGGSSE